MGVGVFEGLLRSTASEFVPEELHGICKVGGFTAVGYLTTLGSNGGAMYGFTYSLVYPTMHHVSRVFLGRHSAIIDRIIQFSIETFLTISISMQVVSLLGFSVGYPLPIFLFIVHKIPCYFDRILEVIMRINE